MSPFALTINEPTSAMGQLRSNRNVFQLGKTAPPNVEGSNNSVGSNADGERTANSLTLIETAKLNGLEPERDLTEVISRIASVESYKLREVLP